MIEDPHCQDGINNDLGQDPNPGLVDFDGGQSVWGECTGEPGGCPANVSDPDGDGVPNPDPGLSPVPPPERLSTAAFVSPGNGLPGTPALFSKTFSEPPELLEGPLGARPALDPLEVDRMAARDLDRLIETLGVVPMVVPGESIHDAFGWRQ